MSEAREKMAPVQGYPGGIPWAIHLEAYEVYSKKWSPQPALIDLEGRNCRGGFGTSELDEFVPGWRDRVSEFGKMKNIIPVLLADLREAAATLRRYEALHRAKNTEDSLAKAEVNAALATRFEATIAKACQ
jgi:hypothetical protein